MPAPTPEQLRADRHCLMVLARTLSSAEPEEGCALLLGRGDGARLTLVESWPCLNRWQPAGERHRRFSLDPREQLLAQRWARARGLQVIGTAHSHPTSAAVPSATDLALCWGPTLMLIRSGLEPVDGGADRGGANGMAAAGAEGVRAWWIPGEGAGAPRELPIAVAKPARAGPGPPRPAGARPFGLGD